jgi:hypothetical protein
MVKVLFIAGWLRSGTTVTGNVLGSAPSAEHIGELNYLWMKVHPAGFECGCGNILWQCPLWKPVLDRLRISQERRYEIRQLRRDSWRNGDVPARYLDWRRGRVDLAYPRVLGEVYRAVAEESGARLVIDCTKNVSDALAAALAPDVDLHLLHVVRDPRAAAFSSKQQKVHGSDAHGIPMKQLSASRNTFHWDVRNLLIERCARPAVAPGRYRRVRYEDLMGSPRSAFGEVAQWAGLGPDELPFTDESTIRVAGSHTVMGNPNRHDVGRELELRTDTRWVDGLGERDVWAATLLGSPLMARYGYPYRRPRR